MDENLGQSLGEVNDEVLPRLVDGSGRVCSACLCIVRPIMPESSKSKITHFSIVYFLLLLSCTVIFNLWEQRIKNESQRATSYQFLQYFEIFCMAFALIYFLYIDFATRGQVDFQNHERNLILYFRTGLYVFGISSLVYTSLNLLNYCHCGNGQQIILNTVKSLYIIGQILFLNRFYQAKLPGNNQLIQIALAHTLGTNLSLWIWTLCQEVYVPKPIDVACNSFPIRLEDTEKYFYPLFIEYLLLVASMIYEIWANVVVTRPEGERLRHEIDEEINPNHEEVHRPDGAQEQPMRNHGHGRLRFEPSVGFSLIIGLIFASCFIAFVLASNDSGNKHPVEFFQFLIVTICMYISQIVASYIILFRCQSQGLTENRRSINLDDALLYFGLAGILLWEGFHLYGLYFTSDKTQPLEFFNSAMCILQATLQTTALIRIRRCSGRNDRAAQHIPNCGLFLLATNFALWCQNSFYIEKYLENPGENHEKLERNLDVFAHILNPLIIFFRFHSATCAYHVWAIFTNHEI